MCFEFKISIWAKISDNFGKTSVFFIKADSAVGSAGDQFHHLAVIFSYLLLRVFQALVNFELIIVTHSHKLAVCSSASVLSYVTRWPIYLHSMLSIMAISKQWVNFGYYTGYVYRICILWICIPVITVRNYCFWLWISLFYSLIIIIPGRP